MLTIKIVLVSIVASSVSWAQDDLKTVLDGQNQRLQRIEAQLESDFQTNTKDAFWAHKLRVDRMFQEGRADRAKEVLNMVQLATLVQSLRYAILRKTISATKDIINHRLVESGQGFLDPRGGVVVLPQMLPVIVSRAILRGYADGSRFVDNTWNWLHLVMEFYHDSIPGEVRQIAAQAYRQRSKFLEDTRAAADSYASTLKAALNDIGIHKANSDSIVSVFDRMINEAMQCSSCLSQGPSSDYYQTGPMFADESAVGPAVERFVDQDLQDAFTDIDGVFLPTREAQAKVSSQQVENLRRRILAV